MRLISAMLARLVRRLLAHHKPADTLREWEDWN